MGYTVVVRVDKMLYSYMRLTERKKFGGNCEEHECISQAVDLSVGLHPPPD